jgi:RNA polymerase sigma factor (sigma-70 family)
VPASGHLTMNAEEYTDLQLVEAIKRGGTIREKALLDLYIKSDLRIMVYAYISDNGGNRQDGKDMYQEGIIVLDRNIRHGKFRGESNLETYLFSICKFLWLNRKRKTNRMDLKEDTDTFEIVQNETPEITFINREQSDALKTLIKGLGGRCQKVLKLWQLSYPMMEISDKAGLSSEGMARKIKYQCLKKLIDMVSGNSNLKNQFDR